MHFSCLHFNGTGPSLLVFNGFYASHGCDELWFKLTPIDKGGCIADCPQKRRKLIWWSWSSSWWYDSTTFWDTCLGHNSALFKAETKACNAQWTIPSLGTVRLGPTALSYDQFKLFCMHYLCEWLAAQISHLSPFNLLKFDTFSFNRFEFLNTVVALWLDDSHFCTLLVAG